MVEEENLQFLKNMVIPKGEKDCLSGLTFVITGTLPALNRKDAEKLIKKYGGKVGSSVTDKTDLKNPRELLYDFKNQFQSNFPELCT